MCPKKNEQYMQIHQWSWSYQTRIFKIVYKYVEGNEKVNKMDEEMKDINRKLRSITKYNRQIKNITSRFLKINKVIEHLNNNVNQLDQLTNYCQYST